MPVRKTQQRDIEAVAAIYAYAKGNFKRMGIDQWQGVYPDRAIVEHDIAHGIGYVLEHEGEVAGAVALTTGDEPAYGRTYDGSWVTEGTPYVTVHRIAIAERCKGMGLSKHLMAEAERLAESLGFCSVRADTHPDNKPMQGLFASCGYTRCGTFLILSGDEKGGLRHCYEKVVKKEGASV